MRDFPTPRYVKANNVSFAVYEQGPENGQPILLLHGWPEIAYSWKPIMPALAKAGYRAIAIDQKGFGASDKPDDARAYGMDTLTDDFAALIKALGYDKLIICGHDWGGATVWPMAYRYPELIEGVVGICTPHRHRTPVAPMGLFEQMFGPDNYIVRFQDEEEPTRAFGGKEAEFFRYIFRKSQPKEAWPHLLPQALNLTENFKTFEGCTDEELAVPADELDVFIKAYQQSGHKTTTMVYRNIDHNWKITEGVDLTVRQPSLMLSAELDMALPPETACDMPDLCPNLEQHIIQDCGHWAMWEQPDFICEKMINWLGRNFS